ncbi:MAG: RNA polymerase sigma factor [Kofleriaceae bacterium]
MVGPDLELAQLAARMREGDARAFEAWVRGLHPLVYRLCRRLVAHPPDAEDAVQDTFLRAWRNARTLREPAAHRGWVCQIARRTCADRARSAGTRARPALELTRAITGSHAVPSDDVRADDALHTAEVRAAVAAAIDRLKETHRVVLLLREVDDLTYDEIADALGIPRGTVESRLHRARAELGRALARHRLIEERTLA